MIGNDIVDLKQASLESNWKRKGFLNKLFSKKEQYYIHNSKDAHQMVWRLWSMKESAYKIYAKQYQKRAFNPKSFECEILSETQGKVSIANKLYYSTSKLNDNYIYTTSVSSLKECIVEHCFTTNAKGYKASSHICHANLKTAIANQQGIDLEMLTIKKDSVNTPCLFYNNAPLHIAFSITHHGNYGAYALLEN